MNKYIARFKQEIDKEGFSSAVKKTIKNSSIRVKRKLTENKRSAENWKQLKGKFAGKRVFLVGNGPSLNKTPLYLLQNEYTMCFNRFNVMFERLGWTPKFYMCADPLVANDMADEINQIVPQVEIAFFPDIHTHGLDFRTFINDKENVQWMSPDFKGFYFDLPKVALGGTVAYPALQVLTYLGFSELYLIGVDMNYQIHKTVKEIQGTDVASTKDDDPNHFDPRYFGKNRKYHQPVQAIMDNMLGSLDYAAQQIKANSNTNVVNAGIGSMVESFPKIDFNSLFNYTDQEAFELLSKPFVEYLPVKNYEELLEKVPLIKSKEEIPAGADYFILEQELGVNVIKELIFDYIPFGPYKGVYLFISRKVLNKAFN
jgi:hypothetical protein